MPALIERRSQPFAGAPAIIAGLAFQDIQALLVNHYYTDHLSRVLGVRGLCFPYGWTTFCNAHQLTPITWQEGLHRLVIPIAGSAVCFAVDSRKDMPHSGEVISFRLVPGTSEAVWIPPAFAAGFYAVRNNTILLTAASMPQAPPSGAISMEEISVDFNAVIGTRPEALLAEVRVG